MKELEKNERGVAEVPNGQVIVVETVSEYMGEATSEDIAKLDRGEPMVLYNAHRVMPMSMNENGQVVSTLMGPYELHVVSPLSWRPATPNETRAFMLRVHPSGIVQAQPGELTRLSRLVSRIGTGSGK